VGSAPCFPSLLSALGACAQATPTNDIAEVSHRQLKNPKRFMTSTSPAVAVPQRWISQAGTSMNSVWIADLFFRYSEVTAYKRVVRACI
jgi:hypothetical protein